MPRIPYIHLGADTVVKTRDIVGIFDMEKTTGSAPSRQFLADAEKGGRVAYVTYELPKSYIVTCEKDGTETVYISQVSAATLRRRMHGNTQRKGKGKANG